MRCEASMSRVEVMFELLYHLIWEPGRLVVIHVARALNAKC